MGDRVPGMHRPESLPAPSIAFPKGMPTGRKRSGQGKGNGKRIMGIRTDRHGDRTALILEGVVGAAESPRLRRLLEDGLVHGNRLVVDLSRTVRIDSAILANLIEALFRARRRRWRPDPRLCPAVGHGASAPDPPRSCLPHRRQSGRSGRRLRPNGPGFPAIAGGALPQGAATAGRAIRSVATAASVPRRAGPAKLAGEISSI